MRSSTQQIAELAYDCVLKVKGTDFEEKYKSYAKKLPSMVNFNGLLTTFAFMKSKSQGDSKEKRAYKTLLEHSVEFFNKIAQKQDWSYENLIKNLSELEFSEYRLLTVRFLEFAIWLKRIAEGELGGEDEGE